MTEKNLGYPEPSSGSDRVIVINCSCPSDQRPLRKINKGIKLLLASSAKQGQLLSEIDEETTKIAEVLLEEIAKLKAGAITIEQLEATVGPRINRLKQVGRSEE